MPAIARLHRHVRETCLPYLPDLHTPAEDLAFFQGHVFASCTIWLAEAEGRPTGFAAFRPGWLDHLYVDPAWHGRGVGQALLSVAKEAQSELNLWTFQRNVQAAPVLRAAGLRARRPGRRLRQRGAGAGCALPVDGRSITLKRPHPDVCAYIGSGPLRSAMHIDALARRRIAMSTYRLDKLLRSALDRRGRREPASGLPRPDLPAQSDRGRLRGRRSFPSIRTMSRSREGPAFPRCPSFRRCPIS